VFKGLIMALVDCEECGKPVSDRADACPHCGWKHSAWDSFLNPTPHPTKPRKKWKDMRKTEQLSWIIIFTWLIGVGGYAVLNAMFDI